MWKWLKNIFKEKTTDELYTVKITEHDLSDEQLEEARRFYDNHKNWIHKIMKEPDNENEYPPTEVEDKNDPRLWKPQYWKWFVNNIL